jgi:hypothetical protein
VRTSALLLLLISFVLPPAASAQTVDYTVELLGTPTKTSGCTVRSGNLPDSSCTPGAVFPNVPLEVLCQVDHLRKAGLPV